MKYINLHTHFLDSDTETTSIINHSLGVDNQIEDSSFFSIGIHPWDVALTNENSLAEIEKFILQKNCLAIGECGLDIIYAENLALQKKIFIGQLQLAVTHRKPVIIHCVKVFDELIALCEPYQNKLTLIIHGFNKSPQLAQQLITNGFLLSLNALLFTTKRVSYAHLDLDKLFLETDNNTNTSIKKVYELASIHFNIESDELRKRFFKNFNTVFTVL